MSIAHEFIRKAGQSLRRIVLPEGADPRIVQAARRLLDEGICHPVLLGDPAAVEAGVSTDGLEWIQPKASDRVEAYAEQYAHQRDIRPAVARRIVQRDLYYATMMIAAGDADGLVGGVANTTAALLFRLFHPATTRVEQAVFSEIMPRLAAGTADFGVCIHEGRFTWQNRGLALVEDLGSRWEKETHSPLPLGGIVASRRLPADVIATVQSVIHDSLQFALADPAAPLPTMRAHAQEFDDLVLRQHVDLYVNEWTLDLGSVGRKALHELSSRAAAVGVGSGGPLEIFSG